MWKWTVQWHSVYCHCCVAITTIYHQDLDFFPNWNSVLIKHSSPSLPSVQPLGTTVVFVSSWLVLFYVPHLGTSPLWFACLLLTILMRVYHRGQLSIRDVGIHSFESHLCWYLQVWLFPSSWGHMCGFELHICRSQLRWCFWPSHPIWRGPLHFLWIPAACLFPFSSSAPAHIMCNCAFIFFGYQSPSW